MRIHAWVLGLALAWTMAGAPAAQGSRTAPASRVTLSSGSKGASKATTQKAVPESSLGSAWRRELLSKGRSQAGKTAANKVTPAAKKPTGKS